MLAPAAVKLVLGYRFTDVYIFSWEEDGPPIIYQCTYACPCSNEAGEGVPIY